MPNKHIGMEAVVQPSMVCMDAVVQHVCDKCKMDQSHVVANTPTFNSCIASLMQLCKRNLCASQGTDEETTCTKAM